jgi:hypothetical protein
MIINGNLDLSYCENLTSLGNLEKVNGNLYLEESNIKTLGNLKTVNGDLNLDITFNLESLGKLEKVNGNLSLYQSHIILIEKDIEIIGNLDLNHSKINFLNSKLTIDGNLNLEWTKEIKNFSNKSIYVGGDLYLYGSNIESLLRDLVLGGRLYLVDSSGKNKIPDFIEIKGKKISLNKTKITKEYILENHKELIRQCIG